MDLFQDPIEPKGVQERERSEHVEWNIETEQQYLDAVREVYLNLLRNKDYIINTFIGILGGDINDYPSDKRSILNQIYSEMMPHFERIRGFQEISIQQFMDFFSDEANEAKLTAYSSAKNVRTAHPFTIIRGAEEYVIHNPDGTKDKGQLKSVKEHNVFMGMHPYIPFSDKGGMPGNDPLTGIAPITLSNLTVKTNMKVGFGGLKEVEFPAELLVDLIQTIVVHMAFGEVTALELEYVKSKLEELELNSMVNSEQIQKLEARKLLLEKDEQFVICTVATEEGIKGFNLSNITGVKPNLDALPGNNKGNSHSLVSVDLLSLLGPVLQAVGIVKSKRDNRKADHETVFVETFGVGRVVVKFQWVDTLINHIHLRLNKFFMPKEG